MKYDFVVADNTTRPHVKVVARDENDESVEHVVAVFYIGEHYNMSEGWAVHEAMAIVSRLNAAD